MKQKDLSYFNDMNFKFYLELLVYYSSDAHREVKYNDDAFFTHFTELRCQFEANSIQNVVGNKILFRSK